MRRALALSSIVAVGALSACVPPPDGKTTPKPALCATHPVTHHIFGTADGRCNNGLPYIVVDEPCGPLIHQDACGKWHNKVAGPNGLPVGYVIGNPSSWRPAEGDGPWTQVR